MRLVEAFMVFNVKVYDVENTSSNGWEYLVCWKDLGLSPMYDIIYYLFYYYF